MVGRPIAFEETLGHHPQKAARILAVYAFFIDDGFDMRRAWYSAAYSEEGLLVSKVAADPEGHISAPNKARTTTRLIEPTSVVESLMQINGPCRSLQFTFEAGGSASQDGRPENLDFTPDCVGTYAPGSDSEQRRSRRPACGTYKLYFRALLKITRK